jgi:hypothetical protein
MRQFIPVNVMQLIRCENTQVIYACQEHQAGGVKELPLQLLHPLERLFLVQSSPNISFDWENERKSPYFSSMDRFWGCAYCPEHFSCARSGYAVELDIRFNHNSVQAHLRDKYVFVITLIG